MHLLNRLTQAKALLDIFPTKIIKENNRPPIKTRISFQTHYIALKMTITVTMAMTLTIRY